MAPREVAAAQTVVAEASVAPIVAIREAVQEIAPTPPPDECIVAPAAVALIVRYEVSSPAYYEARLLAPVWPGAASGVTWGIGYDGGYQSSAEIRRDWVQHVDVARLARVSGVVGPPARALLPGLADVRTPFALAESVFRHATLPEYCRLTARTFARGWDTLPPHARGGLVATVYNRGAAMQGRRRAEMRMLRDECVPAGDTACMARAFRAMSRLWAGTPVGDGLRARYEATAELVEGR